MDPQRGHVLHHLYPSHSGLEPSQHPFPVGLDHFRCHNRVGCVPAHLQFWLLVRPDQQPERHRRDLPVPGLQFSRAYLWPVFPVPDDVCIPLRVHGLFPHPLFLWIEYPDLPKLLPILGAGGSDRLLVHCIWPLVPGFEILPELWNLKQYEVRKSGPYACLPHSTKDASAKTRAQFGASSSKATRSGSSSAGPCLLARIDFDRLFIRKGRADPFCRTPFWENQYSVIGFGQRVWCLSLLWFPGRKVSEKPPFANGSEVLSVSTPFGKIAILICGDLFDDLTIEKMDKPVDLLLVPMSRSFDLKSPDQNRWLKEERSAYLEAVKRAGCLTVLVNALESDVDEGSFGGALVVNEEGHLLAESPHGTDRLLIYDY
jgi:hypothetical protein